MGGGAASVPPDPAKHVVPVGTRVTVRLLRALRHVQGRYALHASLGK